MNKILQIWTDGGARGNPGPAAVGIVLKVSDGSLEKKSGTYIGEATNNVAEYTAVVQALQWVKDQPHMRSEIEKIQVYMDSQLVAYQLTGTYKIKDKTLQAYAFQVQTLIKEIKKEISFTYIPREKNKEADRLVNEALDSRD